MTVDKRAREKIIQIMNGITQEEEALQRTGEFSQSGQRVNGAFKHFFIVRAYHDGPSLSSVIADHPEGLEPQEACAIVLETAKALERHARKHDLLHFDLKAGNILLTEEGVKLIDWGGSQFRETDEDAPRPVGQFTPNAAAPEQLREGKGTMASQVYCLGLLLMRLLGGKNRDPFAAVGIDVKAGTYTREDVLKRLTWENPNIDEAGDGLYGLLRSTPYGKKPSYIDAITASSDYHTTELLQTILEYALSTDPDERMPIAEFIAALEEAVRESLKKSGK
jgi:serine/threonine protein kinase